MPRGSRNPVIVQRETEAAHRALRKLRAKSSIMAPISFERPVPQMQELAQETSGPIIALRCPALLIRHSVSDLPPASGKAASSKPASRIPCMAGAFWSAADALSVGRR
jgi:hypothetical protein